MDGEGRRLASFYKQSNAKLSAMLRDMCLLQSEDHCRELIEAAQIRIHEIAEGVNVCVSPKEYDRAWAEFTHGAKKCVLCGKKKSRKEFRRHYGEKLDVAALHDGQEIVVRACSPKCRQSAWERFERTKQCLERQTRELKNVKRVATTMRQVLREMGREVRRSPAEESEQLATSQSS